MTLVGGHLDPGAGDHVVQAAAGQLAIARVGLGIEQDVTLGGIGRALGHQIGDHRQHLGDMVGGAGREGRRQGAQGRRVLRIDLCVAVGDGLDRRALGGGLGVDLVIHVGDVARIDHRLGAVEMAQQAKQHVEDHHRPAVADVDRIIDGGPAYIHRHPVRIPRNEGPLLAAHGVVQRQVHRQGWAIFTVVGCGTAALPPYSGSSDERPRGAAFIAKLGRAHDPPTADSRSGDGVARVISRTLVLAQLGPGAL